MQRVLHTPGAKLLYTGIFVGIILIISTFSSSFDIDSIIVQHAKGIEPIKSGQMLGEMQREYMEWQIVEFCCGGPKQYGFHLRNRATGEEKYIRKIRVCKARNSNFNFCTFLGDNTRHEQLPPIAVCPLSRYDFEFRQRRRRNRAGQFQLSSDTTNGKFKDCDSANGETIHARFEKGIDQ